MAFPKEHVRTDLAEWSLHLEHQPLTETLRWAWDTFGPRAAIGTSFQGAGLVILHHAVSAGLPFPVFTLDTGLLFPETLELKARLETFLGISIESLHPERTVEEQAEEEGPELWNRAPDVCCHLRKVVPLQKKLATLDMWITGVRRGQGETREATSVLEAYQFDSFRDEYLYKLNPMAAWTRDAVWEYLKKNGIPYNPLHDRGFRSIGCIPCTRPVGEGDSERAGRWTGFDKTECGIHTFMGRAVLSK
ncbi:MAG: phosphoadenylyl-sulfate reductase [Capsulimonadales bacterium]|nr:phosphoadenylyl-sulfate reductase [Capsulimonadales bacterium]